MKLPKISFIIASVDRDDQLRQCIASVEKAHEARRDIPIEVLVVIQKAQQKKDLRILYPAITTVYYIDTLGLSAARNFAIKKSTGDYLVFLDDDAGVQVDFIGILSKKVAEHQQVHAFCGRLIDSAQNIPFSRLFHNNKEKWLRRLNYQYFMGSGHVLSRSVINKIGCYDERFGVGSSYYRGGEETVMFFRLKVAGELVLYLPDLVFYHPIPTASPAYVKNYGHAFAAMMTHCLRHDKAFFFIYVFIMVEKILKAFVRTVQKFLFGGAYTEMDEKYHYAHSLRGMFQGSKDYIKNEFFLKK